MHPAFWKTVSAVLLLCVLFQQYTLRAPRPVASGHYFNTPEKIEAPEFTQSEAALDLKLAQEQEEYAEFKAQSQPWVFDWKRDADNHGLSEAQCDSAFPELWGEIDRAREHWREKKITTHDIDMYDGNYGGVRILIHDSQLRVIKTRGLARDDFRHRIIAVLQQVLRSITAAEANKEPIPDVEFTVVVDDKPVQPPEKENAYWSFTRAFANPRHDSIWVIPDFHFFGAPPEAEGFRQMRERFTKHDSPLTKKIPKVVWRGAIWTNPEVRNPLLEVTEGRNWADVKAMNWDDPETVMPMDAFCRFKYVINTEGRSWSARLTHLLNCDSLLIVHDVEWIAHYYHLLDTDTNCVHVERNFSDLEETISQYESDTLRAQEIANNTRSTFRERYTTPAATACYWRKLLHAWAEVSFTPKVTVPVKNKHKLASKEKWRGISFEEFIVHENTEDYPYIPKEEKKNNGKDKARNPKAHRR